MFALALLPLLTLGATLPEARVDGTVAPGPIPGQQLSIELAAFDGGYFATWFDTRTAEVWPDLWGTALDLNGSTVGQPVRLVGGPGTQEENAIACGNSVCLAVWSAALRFLGRRFDFQGNPLDPPNVPLALSGPVVSYASYAAVSFEGPDFRVVWCDTGGTYTRTVSESGTLGPIARILSSSIDWPRLVSGPAGTLLAYQGPGGVASYRRALPDGGFSPATVLGNNLYFDGISAAAGSDGWLVTWVNSMSGKRFASRIDGDGGNLDPGGIDLGGSGGPPITAAKIDGGFLLAWTDSSQISTATVSDLGALTTLPDTPLGDVSLNGFSLAMQGSEGLAAFPMGPRGSAFKFALRNVVGTTIAPERPPLMTGPNGQVRPSVARGPQGFLAAWEDDRLDAGSDIRAVRLDESGRPIGMARDVAAGSQAQRTPIAVFDGSNYVVVWKQLDSDETIKAVWLDSSANPVGAPRTVASALTAIWDRPAAAAGPQGVVVAWNTWQPSGHELFTSLLADGGVGPDLAVTPGRGSLHEPSLAFGGGVFALVAHAENRGAIELTRLDDDGVALPGGQITVASGVNGAFGTAVASDGQQFLAVWAAKGSKQWSIFGRRFDPAGQMIDLAPLTLFDAINTIETSYETDPRPAVAFDGNQFVVSFARLDAATGGDVVEIRVSRDGMVEAPKVIEGGAEDQSDVALVAGTPGRTLTAYRTFDGVLGVPRVAVRVVANVETGFFCEGDAECSGDGTCVAARCCAADGGCTATLPDGGTILPDGGTPLPDGGIWLPDGGTAPAFRNFRVGCGCANASGVPFWVALIWASSLLRRRRIRVS